jgi:DNA polymerase/3'-5' exonuclease PolX
MSTGVKTPYDIALAKAQALAAALEPYCERILIAGSLRRQKPEVGDLELVIIRRVEDETDMFDLPTGRLIDTLTPGLEAIGISRFTKNGSKLKQFTWQDMTAELYIATRDTWGCLATIRTGSSDFSQWLVTDKRHGGACPGMYAFKEGRLCVDSVPVPTPQEEDVFRLLELEWIDPVERLEGRWRR